jgi:hypothetical protein
MAMPAGSLPTGMVHLTVAVFRSMALTWSLPWRVMKTVSLAALKAMWLGSLASGMRRLSTWLAPSYL